MTDLGLLAIALGIYLGIKAVANEIRCLCETLRNISVTTTYHAARGEQSKTGERDG